MAHDDKEVWRWVPKYEWLYAVSNLGRVYSTRTSRYLRPGRMTEGHMSVALGRGNSRCVHELVLIAFVGPRPKKADARHLNGVPHDNRLGNLVWGSRSDNLRDKKWHGKPGKLTIDDVREAKRLLASGMNCNRVAVRFGVQHQTIKNIVDGKAHIDVT